MIRPRSVRSLLPLLLLGAACSQQPVHGITFRGDVLDSYAYPTMDGDWRVLKDGTKILSDTLCAQENYPVGLAPLDMLLLLDNSYSMDFDGKWTAIRSAIKSFVTDQSFGGLGVGVQYFPIRKQCDTAAYAVPASPIATLPDAAAGIITSLDAQRMFGGTPMVPALQGAVTYSQGWMTTHPGRRAVIVLATDGIPDSTCLDPPAGQLANNIANVVQVARAGATTEPNASSFVIGVGSELTALNQIATAGGTGQAILLDVSKNIEAPFLKALNDIRLRASCEFTVPPAKGGKIDFSQVEVSFKAGGKTDIFELVQGSGKCPETTATGWYYDNRDKPKRVVLCPNTCERVQASEDGKLDIRFGCVYSPS